MNRAKWRDTAQNIVITLLALSAVLLFSQTQFFHLSSSTGRSYFDTTPAGTDSAVSNPETGTLAVPVRLVVSDEYRHSGSITLTVQDEAFLPLKGLLREVLGSSHAPAASNREAFAAALQNSSVFCDFLHTLPLSYLAEHCETSTGFDASVRYLLVSQQQDGVHLFLWDGADRFLRCTTALQSGSLSFTSEQYDLESVFFTSELEHAQHLSLGTFFPETLPALHALSASVPVQNADTLLSTFQFNPHTNSRYTESSGTEVIMDGDRSLRVQPNGTVTYQGGSQSLLRVAASGSPTILEAASRVSALLRQIAPMGDADLYVDSVVQNGNHLQLTFCYEMQGIPICLSDSSHAAVVSLEGNTVTDLTFSPRQYTQTEDPSPLLPLTQAIAVASAQSNHSLYIGYADRGNESAKATWLAE